MPRVTLTKTVPAGPVPLTALTAVTWTAADPANDEQIVITQKDILLIWNTHATTTYTFTITGVADSMGRTADIGPTNLTAGNMVCGIVGFEGFAQAGSPRYVYLEANNAAIRYAVLTFP